MDEKKIVFEDDKAFKQSNVYEISRDDITCGIGVCTFPFLQRLASKKVYVLVYGMVGCFFFATYSYYHGTISTIEKRFKIPSVNSGIIGIGHEISQIFTSVILCYYTSKGHKPRWIGCGLMLIAVYCFLSGLPHFVFGSGDDAIALTKEYIASFGNDSLSTSVQMMEAQKMNRICSSSKMNHKCQSEEGNMVPQIMMFCSHLLSGIGGPIFGTLGIAYMDDNIKKSKSPIYISITNFLKMLGPTLGFALASYCLKLYVAPNVHPTIDNNDPRWVGAYWLGWFILGTCLFLTGVMVSCFPKILPRAAQRLQEMKVKPVETKASFRDMIESLKRLFKNKVYVFNMSAAVFYLFGYLPYWNYQAKYLEIQFRFTAAAASLITGTVSLVFSAVGILISGAIISKYKPRARYLTAWNIITGTASVFGIASYALFGCEAANNSDIMRNSILNTTCNFNCECDYVKYAPVCGSNGLTYISPCHAGCTEEVTFENGTVFYANCKCISATGNFTTHIKNHTQSATSGVCFVNCLSSFYFFLLIMCVNKFLGGTEATSNFLVAIRCVEERDKAVSIALNLTIISLLAFIPSPIFFGYLIDKTCILWGKMCSGTGNCWLYDAEVLRYSLNYTAAVFIVLGTMLDVGTWFNAKNVKIFDEEREKDTGVTKGMYNNATDEQEDIVMLTRKLSVVMENE